METNSTTKTNDRENESEIVQNVQETDANQLEVTEEPPKKACYIEMGQDETGKWHWCLWSANGRAMAGSLTPFNRRNDCQNNIEKAIRMFRDAKLTIAATVGEFK